MTINYSVWKLPSTGRWAVAVEIDGRWDQWLNEGTVYNTVEEAIEATDKDWLKRNNGVAVREYSFPTELWG